MLRARLQHLEKGMIPLLHSVKARQSVSIKSKYHFNRKHYQQSIDDAFTQASKENKEDHNKFKKRWSTKIIQVEIS